MSKERGNILFLALYGHSVSIGQSRHLVASAAAAGFADLRKCFNDPKDETRDGVAGESQWHKISTSLQIIDESETWNNRVEAYWQLLVMREKELFCSLDQLPRTYECAK